LSSDLFVYGAAALAKHWGMPTLLIGMLVVGFGTSSPELTVSALSAWEGNPGIALGNAYGSNITNIALILGLAAVIKPIEVHSKIIKKELPILFCVTLFVFLQIYDGQLTRLDAVSELLVFTGVMIWMAHTGKNQQIDTLEIEMTQELEDLPTSHSQALLWVISGLALLVISSQVLVSGAVKIAHGLGVSDVIIGLTIVAVGTSLPELASAVAAARKGEDDLALGNIIGSNLFNTLAVVGLAGIIHPMQIPTEIVWRDWPVMAVLTASLFFFGSSKTGLGSIKRREGAGLLIMYLSYTVYLIRTIMSA